VWRGLKRKEGVSKERGGKGRLDITPLRVTIEDKRSKKKEVLRRKNEEEIKDDKKRQSV